MFGATYALADVPDAIRQVETGHTRGKVVVGVREPAGDGAARSTAVLSGREGGA